MKFEKKWLLLKGKLPEDSAFSAGSRPFIANQNYWKNSEIGSFPAFVLTSPASVIGSQET
jgi:hypothetical protein